MKTGKLDMASRMQFDDLTTFTMSKSMYVTKFKKCQHIPFHKRCGKLFFKTLFNFSVSCLEAYHIPIVIRTLFLDLKTYNTFWDQI